MVAAVELRSAVFEKVREEALGRSAESWLAMQSRHDLWHAKRRVKLGGVSKVRLPAA